MKRPVKNARPPIAESPAYTVPEKGVRPLFFIGLVATLMLAGAASADELVTLDGKKLDVNVVRVTEAGVVVKEEEGERVYAFDDLKPKSAYEFYTRLFGWTSRFVDAGQACSGRTTRRGA